MKLQLRRKPVPSRPAYVKVKTGEGKKAHLSRSETEGGLAGYARVLCGWKASKDGWRPADPDAPTCNMCQAILENTQGGA